MEAAPFPEWGRGAAFFCTPTVGLPSGGLILSVRCFGLCRSHSLPADCFVCRRFWDALLGPYMAVSYGELEGWWEGWRAGRERVSGGGGE